MSRLIQVYLMRYSLFILLALILSACTTKPPVLIGFAAELTGKNGEMGINLRNGVQLAIEENNAAGGIGGRKIHLLVEDDFGTPQGALNAENKLIAAGVVAIIGHFTSDQTMVGYSVAEAKGVVLLSATASTSLLSGKNDLFFRTVASTDAMGRGLASYIHGKRGIARIATIHDLDNKTYAEPLLRSFLESFTSLGGEVIDQLEFSAAKAPDYSPLVDDLKKTDAAGVLIIASPYDTAMIAQTISLKKWQPVLFISSWAQGQALFQSGGQTVEGMETVMAFDSNDPSPALAQFKSTYEKRFSAAPIFTGMEGYETMRLLAAALQKTNGNSDGLAESLAGMQKFEGLTGPISMDKFGDVIRPLVIQKVKDGKFETIEKLNPEQ
ncbi:MAG: ABC transporter substrate-binding protein [Leptolinea sp.]